MRNFIMAAVAATALAFSAVAAQAYTITTATDLSLIALPAAPSGSQPGLFSQSSFTSGGMTFSFTGATSGLYTGTVGTAKSPFADNASYLASQPDGKVVIDFATAQTSFALLWGTVDTYNSLVFSTGAGETITGTTVASAIPGLQPNGNQASFIVISGLDAFKQVTVLSTQAAFEFAPANVPEPLSLAILGVGLAGLGLARRRAKAA